MPNDIDYEKCKTNRFGLYVMVILIVLSVVVGGGVRNKKLDRLLQMQPCQQQQVSK